MNAKADTPGQNGEDKEKQMNEEKRKKGQHKKTRRSQCIRNKLKKFTVWYQNVRGLKTKFASLLEKIEEFEPTMVCITETHMLKDEPLEIEGYRVMRNDRDNLGGGVLVAVDEKIADICTIVEKESEVGETLWIVIDNQRVPVCPTRKQDHN